MRATINILILLFIFSGCTTLKKLKLAKQGSIGKTNFLEEINFDYHNDLIFVKVSINNNKYNFLYDTGWDITAVSPKVVNDNSLKDTGLSHAYEDAANAKEDFRFLVLDKISIGDIPFKNIAAFTKDFSHFEKILGCIKFDGIIGNNLMRKAKWSIDYTEQIITVTDNLNQIPNLNKAIKIPIKVASYGGANIKVKLNKVDEKFKFDTGFSGAFKANHKLFKKLNQAARFYTTKEGFTGMQATGETKGISYISLIQNLNLPNLNLNDQIVQFDKDNSSLIGNKFFKNFVLSIDWDNKMLYLNPRGKIDGSILKTYKYLFAPNYTKNRIEFYNHYPGHKFGENIAIDSEILEVNGYDVTSLSKNELCEFWSSSKEIFFTDSVSLLILEDGIHKELELIKMKLLPK